MHTVITLVEKVYSDDVIFETKHHSLVSHRERKNNSGQTLKKPVCLEIYISSVIVTLKLEILDGCISRKPLVTFLFKYAKLIIITCV